MNGTTVAVDGDEIRQQCQEQLKILQTVLTQLKLPATVDRRGKPRSGDGPQLTVLLLAEIEESLNIFLEGNRQCPDGFLWVPTANWVTRQPSLSNKEGDTLYVWQAVTADSGGQTYLDIFQPPRVVTYLDNQLFRDVTKSGRADGEAVSAFGLDIPTCSSVALNARADDKILTTSMCAAVGVAHPVTLGLWLRGDQRQPEYPHHYPTVTTICVDPLETDKDHLQAVITAFLHSPLMGEFDQVVVKPCGPAWNSCKGVSFHDIQDVASVLQAVLHLLNLVEPGSGILVQSYHGTFTPVLSPNTDLGRHSEGFENKQLCFRVRAIVVRTPDNGARMTQVVCAIGDSSRPIGGVSSVPTSLSLTLHKWGVKEKEKQRAIYRAIADSCEKLTLELFRQEAMLSPRDRGGKGCQTELVGIDVILTEVRNKLVPLVIEVNSHDCLYHVTVMEMMQPQKRGQTVGVLLRTMLHRAQRHLLAGKTVVAVGAGGFSKRHLFAEAAELGIRLVLVDSDPDHPAKDVVDTFLHVDIADHTQDIHHANTIIHLLQERLQGREISGCMTWWEDCVPLAARVGQALGLPHAVPLEAALNAKSKERTHKVLGRQVEELPHDLVPAVYASPVVRVTQMEEIDKAVQKISMPAVIKLEFGSSAVGVKHVNSIKEVKEHMTVVEKTLYDELCHPGSGLSFGQSMVLMPRLQGTEHDVDLVLFDNQVVAAFVSDNGPTHLPFCMETAAVMPSLLLEEQKQQMISAAATCCRGLGLHTGVFNVEIILTPYGPRLVEVNARMGGFYLRDWIRLLYNVDIFHLAIMCACGIRPVLPENSSSSSSSNGLSNSNRSSSNLGEIYEDMDQDQQRMNGKVNVTKEQEKGYIMGIMLYPSRHAKALATTASPHNLRLLDQEGHIIFLQLEADMAVPEENGFHEPYANLAVRAPTLHEAKAKLITVCTSLGLETEDSMRKLLSDFVDLS